MVQERSWSEKQPGESDSSEEDLHYGPGIVNKLKNRYLSLALRESSAKSRPSILRKATSLEDLLDGEEGAKGKATDGRQFERKANGENRPEQNRYRSKHRTAEIMKRAHSIETISRGEVVFEDRKPKRDSMHEDLLILRETNGLPPNRPKKIAPVVSEKEKPPTDLVKQAKRIFEGRPEQRTRPPHATGEVAAKVATYKSIMVQTKVNKKPLVKQKPAAVKPSSNHAPVRLPAWTNPLPSPIPDVSRINEFEGSATNGLKTTSSLTETPDLILHSSPAVASPKYRLETTQKFIYEEIKQSARDKHVPQVPKPSPTAVAPRTQPTQPLKLDLNGFNNHETPPRAHSSPLQKPTLTVREIEKNLINSAKTLEQPVKSVSVCAESVTIVQVPKVKKGARAHQEQNSVVFKFTDRQDVPDYVGNDGRKRAAKIERPKAGEGGIIILPGASLDESFVDDDEDWMRSLEGPPSPCDVTFINDNILIDGRSSLSQKTKKQKLKISFVEAVPEIFEYPSETSMLDENSSVSNSSVNGAALGHSVPSLAGSTLANYMPKGGASAEEFQLGITRTAVVNVSPISKSPVETVSQIEEQPVLFSAGTNSDMLF